MTDSTHKASGIDATQPSISKKEGGRRVRRFSADLSATGEPALWGFGGALAIGIILIAGFLFMIAWNGLITFWPKPIEVVTMTNGTKLAGEPTRSGEYRVGDDALSRLTEAQKNQVNANNRIANRTLYKTANFDLYGDDFKWLSDFEVASKELPANFFLFERQQWGTFVGKIDHYVVNGKRSEFNLQQLEKEQKLARERFDEIRRIDQKEIGTVNHQLNKERLNIRRAELRYGKDDPEALKIKAKADANIQNFEKEYAVLQKKVNDIRAEDRKTRIVMQEVNGRNVDVELSQIVRFYAANDMNWFQSMGVYLSRWVEFLTTEPREANTQGGVLPAIFGTVAMTLLMVIFVAPFGVITALYLREYAKQGRLVSIVRISVNNLAGVPSIVYGVFGLGFFAYTFGGSIDALFYSENLPNPTFGTGGILWASLTLALLTVPVVIVATEEALAAVPRSMREGSLACGASKWQTIRYVVLPKAMPGVLTGMILAMARGAGEVAPLMLVGVVKLAPALPIDGFFPFIHLERSFMHLGFHIFDVGFQSRNSEAGKPMVFVTTLLLLALIVMMNATAIYLRNRLKRRYAGSQF